jgi:hypothetical protein
MQDKLSSEAESSSDRVTHEQLVSACKVLAKLSCAKCHGAGLIRMYPRQAAPIHKEGAVPELVQEPCDCVLRKLDRIHAEEAMQKAAEPRVDEDVLGIKPAEHETHGCASVFELL